MFTAALFTVGKGWTTQMAVNRLLKKMWSISTVDYYSVMKRNELH